MTKGIPCFYCVEEEREEPNFGIMACRRKDNNGTAGICYEHYRLIKQEQADEKRKLLELHKFFLEGKLDLPKNNPNA